MQLAAAAGIATVSLLFAHIALAQMVTGSAMDNFAGAFGLTGKGVTVQQTAFEVSGKPSANVLWPGEEARVSFHIKMNDGSNYNGKITFDVVQYGTQSIPDDIWKPHVFKIRDVSSSVVDVDLPSAGGFVTISPRLGDAFGGYAIILDIPGKGKYFGATCCRTVRAEPGRVFMPTYALDLGWPFEMSPAVFNAFKKMGIKGARTEGGFNTIDDAHPDWALQNDVTLMLCVGARQHPCCLAALGPRAAMA